MKKVLNIGYKWPVKKSSVKTRAETSTFGARVQALYYKGSFFPVHSIQLGYFSQNRNHCVVFLTTPLYVKIFQLSHLLIGKIAGSFFMKKFLVMKLKAIINDIIVKCR